MTFLQNNRYFILGTAVFIIVGIIFMWQKNTEPRVIRNNEIVSQSEQTPEQSTPPEPEPEPPEPAEPPRIIVHVSGAVNNAGVYELPDTARVNDALIAAGGENEHADLSQVNLADYLRDGMKVHIPAADEAVQAILTPPADGSAHGSGRGDNQANNQNSGLININTATSEELQKLSGVGAVLAQNIIDFREANGSFASVDELVNVPRIGAATVERLRPSITVG